VSASPEPNAASSPVRIRIVDLEAPKQFEGIEEKSDGLYSVLKSVDSEAIPVCPTWSREVNECFARVHVDNAYPPGVKETCEFVSGVDTARCFIHAPVTASGLSRATRDAVMDAWRVVVTMGRTLYMAGDDRLLAVAMCFFLPAMCAVDFAKRPRARRALIKHDREVVMRRVQRFQKEGFICLPELLGEFSDLCGEAAEKRGVAPELTQHEKLSKVVEYVQRGGSVKRALEKVTRTKVGLEGVLGAAQQAFPEVGGEEDELVHPGMPANDLELLLRPCVGYGGWRGDKQAEDGAPAPFRMPSRG
jgi:hypothetical protein